MKQGVNDGENISARGEAIFRAGRTALIKLSFSLRSLIAGKGVVGASSKAGGHWTDGSHGFLLPFEAIISNRQPIYLCFKHFSPFLWGFACLLRRGRKKIHCI